MTSIFCFFIDTFSVVSFAQEIDEGKEAKNDFYPWNIDIVVFVDI